MQLSNCELVVMQAMARCITTKSGAAAFRRAVEEYCENGGVEPPIISYSIGRDPECRNVEVRRTARGGNA